MSNQTVDNKFYWGAATAAFQIEGSPLADGAVASDWYLMTQKPGLIAGGDHADIACDHYRRWQEDVKLIREMGLNAYRFSMAWNRIVNEPGSINLQGLAFYDRLVDALLGAGIEPFPTMFHWELPEWLVSKGGWVHPDSTKFFAEYANILFDKFSDRVSKWITLNEPFVYYHSYITEFHLPFKKDAYTDLLKCCNHQLIGHQQALDNLKNNYKGQAGFALSYSLVRPGSDSPEDQLAAKRADGVRNRWFLDRMFYGRYPADILEMYGDYAPPECHETLDMTKCNTPDFIGLNYYCPTKVKNDPQTQPFRFSDAKSFKELQPVTGSEPDGLFEMLTRVNKDYGSIPLYITENGKLEYETEYQERDRLQDDARIEYLSGHLEQVKRCVDEGLPLRGYFHWSLLDNFEWRWGLGRRYGLIYVDRETQDREFKKSAYFYKAYVKQHPEGC